MKIKYLFSVTATIEIGIGLALLLVPQFPIYLLLGTPLETPSSQSISRMAGAALFSLGLACWWARNDEQSPAAIGLVATMLTYNIAAVAILAYAGVGLGVFGVGLWPAIFLHSALAVWCLTCFRGKLVNVTK